MIYKRMQKGYQHLTDESYYKKSPERFKVAVKHDWQAKWALNVHTMYLSKSRKTMGMTFGC